MKEFISEYGFLIMEAVGGAIGIGLLYVTFFGGGAFGEFISNFLSSLMGG